MTRLKNWPSRFAALEESVRARPFEWGSHDCCMWAAAAVQAVTGADLAAEWRGKYSDEATAEALMRSLGGLPGIAALAGPELQASAHATTGDIGIVAWPDRTLSLGVYGGQSWLCVGDSGLVHLAREAALRAWGVGRE